MKKTEYIIIFLTLLLFVHSYSVVSFSLRKSLSLVREKFGQFSAPKKIFIGYLALTVPYELWKIGSYYKKLKIDEIQFLSVKTNVIHSLCDIFIFPFTSRRKWDDEDPRHKNFYYNPVFGILCAFTKKIFFRKNASKKCALAHLHLSKDNCSFCPKSKKFGSR